MSHHRTDFQGSITDAIREAIVAAIADADVLVSGGGGHFSIEVTSAVFAGQTRVDSQQLVYGAIALLMKGDLAPVHAVDTLRTHVR